MASATVTKKLREEATCPACLELITEPRTIDCGHSYCRVCLLVCICNRPSKRSPGTFYCPQCGKSFKSDNIRSNKQLENIIETIKETDNKNLCKEHGQQLHRFCEDDGQFICWRCELSPKHKGHVTTFTEDAYKGYKERHMKAVRELNHTESNYMQQKLGTPQEIYISEGERIHSEFMKLHTFLHEEEEFYMCQLEKENEQKLRRLQDNVAHLDNKLQEIKNSILELDKKYQGSAQNLLQHIKHTLSRNSTINMEIPEDVSLEVDTECHVCELYIGVKKVLRRYKM